MGSSGEFAVAIATPQLTCEAAFDIRKNPTVCHPEAFLVWRLLFAAQHIADAHAMAWLPSVRRFDPWSARLAANDLCAEHELDIFAGRAQLRPE